MATQRVGRMRRYAPLKDAVAACLGKTKWNTERAAQWSVTRIRADNPQEVSSTVRPYRCAVCKKFHVGHGQ